MEDNNPSVATLERLRKQETDGPARFSRDHDSTAVKPALRVSAAAPTRRSSALHINFADRVPSVPESSVRAHPPGIAVDLIKTSEDPLKCDPRAENTSTLIDTFFIPEDKLKFDSNEASNNPDPSTYWPLVTGDKKAKRAVAYSRDNMYQDDEHEEQKDKYQKEEEEIEEVVREELKGRPSLAMSLIGSLKQRQSVLSRKSYASKMSSNHSVHSQSQDGIIANWLRKYDDFQRKFYASEQYAKYYSYVASNMLWSVYYRIIQMTIYAFILFVVKVVMGEELTSLNIFNLLHSILAYLGKAAFLLVYNINTLSGKSLVAYEMVSNPGGVPLAYIAMPPQRINPETGRTLRILCYVFACILEVCIWLLGYYMQWKPVTSFIGTFQCNQAVYTKKPDFSSSGFRDYLQGTNQFAIYYSYGLALGDGIIGGFSQWPIQIPDQATQFTVSGPGVIFAVSTYCDLPIVANTSTYKSGTENQFWNPNKWVVMYSTDVSVQYPGGSHNYMQALDKDIIQNCQILVTSGNAKMAVQYTFDEFLVSDSGKIQEIDLGVLQMTQNMALTGHEDLFGNIALALGSNGTLQGKQMTAWIGEGINVVFNNQTYLPTQSGTYANLFEWGANPAGVYDISLTPRGVSSAVAAVAHYILMQYDPNYIGPCDYYGMMGHGQVQTSDFIKTLVIISVAMCIILQMTELLWLVINCQNGPIYDRAAKVLESPLRLLYDFRNSATTLMTELEQPGIGDINLEAKFSTVMVRFGEDRKTRGEEVGKVLLDTPKNVFKMHRKRKYESIGLHKNDS